MHCIFSCFLFVFPYYTKDLGRRAAYSSLATSPLPPRILPVLRAAMRPIFFCDTASLLAQSGARRSSYCRRAMKVCDETLAPPGSVASTCHSTREPGATLESRLASTTSSGTVRSEAVVSVRRSSVVTLT